VRALLCVLLATGSAAADGFAWTAPAACPDASDERARIEHRLADGVAVDGIAVSITHEPDGFVANIAAGDAARTLKSRRCDDLADAVAVVIARLATEAHEAQPVQVASIETTPTRRVNSLAAQPEAGRFPGYQPNEWGGGVRGLALSGIGMVPHVGVGGELAAFVRHHDLFGELGYARWGERPVYLVSGAPGHVDVGLQLATARGGWASSRMPLRAWLGVEVGSITGAGVDLHNQNTGSARWTAIASGFGVGWPMAEHARLVGTFEVAAALERAEFTLGDGSQIFQSARASARCALGLEVGWR
jgi:hypothetical protein